MIGNTGNNSFPDAPDITINNTTVTIDDATALWIDEVFTITESDNAPTYTQFTLSDSPYSNAAVFVFKEGSAGLETTDFTLNDTALTLLVALGSTEKLHVKYMCVQ